MADVLASCIPFVGLLLSMAVCTTFFPVFWTRALAPVTFLWTLPALLYLFCQKSVCASAHVLAHIVFLDYMPFLMLLSALYVVAGGVKLRIHVHATPFANTLVLCGFTFLSGFLGTTGAAMLGIHPLMVMNHHRRYQTHTVICFIFLVCNIGGGLSTIGDPPLFLGFLKGISFFWPTLHLFKPVCFLTALLLVTYFFLDLFFFHKEPEKVQEPPKRPRIRVEGKKQFFLVAGVLFILVTPAIFQMKRMLNPFLLEGVKALFLLGIMGLSFCITSMTWRREHRWTFHPLLEVGVLFAGLFITAHPLIELLAMGDHGPFAPLLEFLGTKDNMHPKLTFWTTGLLSAFLDNAPTYLVFLKATQLTPDVLMTHAAPLLKAISLGAVFMGALTYIGNAPNLLVKAIAEEEYRVAMPSFLTYLFIASVVLLPLFFLITFLL